MGPAAEKSLSGLLKNLFVSKVMVTYGNCNVRCLLTGVRISYLPRKNGILTHSKKIRIINGSKFIKRYANKSTLSLMKLELCSDKRPCFRRAKFDHVREIIIN